MFNTITGQEQPFVNAGYNSLAALTAGVTGPNGGPGALNAPFPGGPPPSAPNLTALPTATAPNFTMADYTQSPGYQFQVQQGQDSVLNNASRLGGVNSGNTLKALTQFGQGAANQDFQQAYNNYNSNYWNTFNANTQAVTGNNANAVTDFNANNQNYWNTQNAYTGNQSQQFNQLLALLTGGQNAAANLGSTGTNVANNVGANQIQSGQVQGAGIIGAGNANSAGTVAQASGISNGLNNTSGNISQNFLLQSLLNQNQASTSIGDYTSGLLSNLNIPSSPFPSVYPTG